MWDNYTALTYNSELIPKGLIPKWGSHGTKSAHPQPYSHWPSAFLAIPLASYSIAKAQPAFLPSSLFLAFSFFSFCASHRELPSPPFVLCIEKFPKNSSGPTATTPSRAKKLINTFTGPFIYVIFSKPKREELGMGVIFFKKIWYF